jgi:hypothetical protein
MRVWLNVLVYHACLPGAFGHYVDPWRPVNFTAVTHHRLTTQISEPSISGSKHGEVCVSSAYQVRILYTVTILQLVNFNSVKVWTTAFGSRFKILDRERNIHRLGHRLGKIGSRQAGSDSQEESSLLVLCTAAPQFSGVKSCTIPVVTAVQSHAPHLTIFCKSSTNINIRLVPCVYVSCG